MQSNEPKHIFCERHGRSEGCMICRHLREVNGLGYYRVEVTPGRDDYETALCGSCDEMLWKEEGWTDRLYHFADWKLFCRGCFDETLKRHRLLGVGRLGEDEE